MAVGPTRFADRVNIRKMPVGAGTVGRRVRATESRGVVKVDGRGEEALKCARDAGEGKL